MIKELSKGINKQIKYYNYEKMDSELNNMNTIKHEIEFQLTEKVT